MQDIPPQTQATKTRQTVIVEVESIEDYMDGVRRTTREEVWFHAEILPTGYAKDRWGNTAKIIDADPLRHSPWLG